MSLLFSESWEGPALPAGFAYSPAGGWQIARDGSAVDGAGCLYRPTWAGFHATVTSAWADTAGGDVAVSCYARADGPWSGGGGEADLAVSGRGGACALHLNLQNPASLNACAVLIGTPAPAVGASLSLPYGSAGLELGAWYWMELTLAGASSQTARVRRVSDGMWLSAAGAWQTAAAVCLTSALPLAAGGGAVALDAFLDEPPLTGRFDLLSVASPFVARRSVCG